jgi:hypothetical protein
MRSTPALAFPVLVAALLLSACKRHTAVGITSSALASPTAPDTSAAPPTSASSAAPDITAAPPTSASLAASNTTAAPSAQWYPPGTNQELKLTWAVYPKTGESEGGPIRNLEVVARIGHAVKRVKLGPHDGYLIASQQSVCNPSLKNATVVSVINFYTMGPEIIFARRVQATLLEIAFTREVDDEPAKTHGTIATIPIPADARIVDAISDIRGAGKEGPFDCSASPETR